MQLMPNTASSEAHLKYAAHFMGAVEAWKDAEIITPEQQAVIVEVGQLVQPSVDNLQTKQAASEAAEQDTSKARARFLVRDVILDLRIMATSDGILNGPAARNREHPIYKQVFQGSTPTEVTRTQIREEPEVVARLRDRLVATADFAGKADLITNLNGPLTKSLEARDALDAAEAAENRAQDEELAARLALRHVLEQAYGKLRAAFPGRRDFVESFFPKRESSTSKTPVEPAKIDPIEPAKIEPGTPT